MIRKMIRQGLKNNIAVCAASILILLMLFQALAPAVTTISAPEEYTIYKYGWFDEVVFFRVTEAAKAVEMMEKGDMDIYFKDIGDPALFRRVRESPALSYDFSYGLYNELTFNPVGPTTLDGKFNPFYNPKIREAMNMLVDRQYIVDEIMGGLAIPKFVPVCNGFPDYKRHESVIKSIEANYAYNFDKAKQIIFEELAKEPDVEYKDGKWLYKGEPIVLKFIIRTEDTRRQIGDYVSTQLEKLGFTVDRQYKTSREASPIWMRGNPAEGRWHLYTGGWVTTVVSRDDSDNFQFFYSDKSGMASISPLWASYKPSPEFSELADKLAEKKFTTIEERTAWMSRAFELALKDSVRVWLVDQTAAWVKRKEINAVADYSGGYWVGIWAFTLNRGGTRGGSVKIGSSDVLTGDAWNPISGSNWIYDGMVSSATGMPAFLSDPKSGLPIPTGFVKSVTIEAVKGLLTFQNPESQNWLTLTFVDSVTIPSDAWYAWDVENKKVVTAGEAGVTSAKVKIVAEYEDIIGKIEYHDGTVMSLADWVWSWPINFERASDKSPLYDEAYVGSFQSWREVFKAWRIVSEHPLKIEWYTDYTNMDAELIASAYVGLAGPWHTTAIGVKAEEKGVLAFGQDKAMKKNVEWMNYIAGPSLEILSTTLDEAIAEGYIPFKELNSRYITVEEARARYNALKKWYTTYKHFWVGAGPYYLEVADVMAKTAVLKPFRKLLQRELVISVEGGGTTDPEPGTHEYLGRETVTITAKPGFLSILEKWVVDGVEKEASASITVTTDKPHTVRAVFRIWYEAIAGIVAVIVVIVIVAVLFLRKKRK
ncbi:MAG: ABC transporter substrate-binding protein [Thermoproteota archaeon]